MGYRIRVAEVYQVKHHVFDNFGGNSEAINRMLAENCPGLSWEGEDVEYSERLEVPRSELGDLIAKIASDKEDLRNRRDYTTSMRVRMMSLPSSPNGFHSATNVMISWFFPGTNQ